MSSVVLRHALIGLRILPVLFVVVLSAPAWVSWPFLPEPRQRMVLDMVKALADWTRVTPGEESATADAVAREHVESVVATTPGSIGAAEPPAATDSSPGADQAG
ncbi:hypothetical protein [Kitasatospora sp. NPDC047058]|uniref:hypothetical protein n=1 Tax=Kitasatospora sp. NPDC047058 TaxID=3155620 RepID=UPI0033F0EEF7